MNSGFEYAVRWCALLAFTMFVIVALERVAGGRRKKR